MRTLHKLTDTAVRALSKPGRHGDGGGLYLRVAPGGSKTWSFVYKRDQRKIELAIGPYPGKSLAIARRQASAWRDMRANGFDPKTERDKAPNKREPTFAEAAERYLKTRERQWTNAKHRQQWHSTLGPVYCGVLSGIRVSEITVDDVFKVLNPIWHKTPETAQRLRGRIEKVLSFAKVQSWRTGENPAMWRDNLEHMLSKPHKLHRGHHAAMDYQDVPDFIDRLQTRDAMAARAFEFLILTAARSGEVLGATWAEMDMEARVWTVPAERMKARRPHRVPLSDAAMAILAPLHEARLSEFVFPGQRPNQPLSNMAMHMLLRKMKVDSATPHGFRSSFRDWCGDTTSFPREVAEQCLAHVIGSEVERAYRRSDALQKRRDVLNAWAGYCVAVPGATVIPMRGR